MLARWPYRVRQFSNVFRGGLTQEEQRVVRQFLTPEQAELFWRMQPLAQRHHIDVALDLLHGGRANPDLIAASLLHDVGKGHLTVWPRVAIVLVKAASPALFERLARRGGPPPLSWLQTHRNHAETGAELLARLGATPRMVELVRRHETVIAGDEEQEALRRADDRH